MFPMRTQAQRVAHMFMFPCVQHRAGMESRDLACPCHLSTCPGPPLVPMQLLSFSRSETGPEDGAEPQSSRSPSRGRPRTLRPPGALWRHPWELEKTKQRQGTGGGGGKQSPGASFPFREGFPSWAWLHNLWNPAQNAKSLRMSWWPLQNINSVWTQCHHGGSPMKPALSVLSRAVRWYMSGTGACREKSLEPAWLSCPGLCKVSPLISQDFGSLVYKLGMITGPLWKLSQFMCAWLGTSHGKICYWCLPTLLF